MKLNAPKGTRDIISPEIKSWQAVEALFRQVVERFGFSEIRVPTFEQTALFQRGVGDGTDIVQKEMYTFEDKAGRSMTLRPEGTAGVVRSFIQKGMYSQPYPVKLYYLGSFFRYENVQEGRYREFHQMGLESFGAEAAEQDVEIIALLHMFFKELGLKETSLRINSLGCPSCRQAYHEALQAFLKPKLGNLCEDCNKRYEKNPLRILDCKNEKCRQISQEAPVLADYLDESCADHFAKVTEKLNYLGIDYEYDKRLVRGLDYYTKTVFEYVSEHVGTQGTICGGGRYDGLVKELNGPQTPAVGFAMGEERLLKELEAQGLLVASDVPVNLFLGYIGAEAEFAAMKLAQLLRAEGMHVETALCGRSIKAQMKYADKKGFMYSAIIGDNELQEKELDFKRMADGEKFSLPITDVKAIVDGLGVNK